VNSLVSNRLPHRGRKREGPPRPSMTHPSDSLPARGGRKPRRQDPERQAQPPPACAIASRARGSAPVEGSRLLKQLRNEGEQAADGDAQRNPCSDDANTNLQLHDASAGPTRLTGGGCLNWKPRPALRQPSELRGMLVSSGTIFLTAPASRVSIGRVGRYIRLHGMLHRWCATTSRIDRSFRSGIAPCRATSQLSMPLMAA